MHSWLGRHRRRPPAGEAVAALFRTYTELQAAGVAVGADAARLDNESLVGRLVVDDHALVSCSS